MAQIDSVNAGLQVICTEENVRFVDNTPIFYLQDNSINDAYYLDDGIHITYKAANKLEQNLQLKTREGFLRKNIVAVSFFQDCAIHPYS